MATIFLFLILFCSLLFYIEIANKFNIIDKPNNRSSHAQSTVRGGGIIFPFSVLLYSLYSNFAYPYFIIGLSLISIISFLDDLFTVSNKLRLLIHLIAVTLLFYELGLFEIHFLILALVFLFITGIVNAYNFMDGINGITVLYSLSIIFSIYFLDYYVTPVVKENFLLPIISSLLIFGFFNIRKRAIVFAGDVGSVSMAFIIVFLLLKVMIQTHSYVWIFFLSFYGIDTVFTIIFRLFRKENIFKAHRSHFYQFLANEKNIKHIYVSLTYSVFQFIYNIIIIYCFLHHNLIVPFIILFLLLLIYLSIRFKLEGKTRLMNKYV